VVVLRRLTAHAAAPRNHAGRLEGVQWPTAARCFTWTQDAMLLSSAALPEDGSEGEATAREATVSRHALALVKKLAS
jgi:hypothetical protein